MRATSLFLVITICACGQSASPRPKFPALPVADLPHTALAVGSDCALTSDDRVRRLACLARIWGQVRFLHPALYDDRWLDDRAVDWDAALGAAIPRVDAATSDDAMASAVASMLRALDDPLTRVDDTSPARRAAGPGTSVRTLHGTLIVKVAPRSREEVAETVASVRDKIQSSAPVVIDLRAPRDTAAALAAVTAVEALASALVAKETPALPMMWLKHDGWAPQQGTTSGGYASYFEMAPAVLYQPSPGEHPARVAFVVNAAVGVPPIALAMQKTGDAVIIEQGRVSQTVLVWSASISLGAHHTINLARAVYERAPNMDAHVDDETLTGGPAIEAAIAALAKAKASPASPDTPLGTARRLVDRTRAHRVSHLDELYESEALPPIGHRLLALFRFWNVIHSFYPYQHLFDSSWDDVLLQFIPRFETAATALDYELAVREIAARIPDSHVHVRGDDEFYKWIGIGELPIRVERVEGLPVITAIDGDASSGSFSVGDVIVDVAGVAFDERAARFTKYAAASNAWDQAASDDALALHCPLHTTVTVHVRGSGEALHEVQFACGVRVQRAARNGPVFTTLAKDIGYVDLARLETSDVDAMFDALASTQAIIFDMRGYPRGTAWAIAPRLNAHPETPIAARFSRMVVGVAADDPKNARASFTQLIPRLPTGKSKYTGKTVMLIDQRTISQAEHTGMFFEAANGTKFIGSPTAGANGDVTNVCLPGALCVSFTGHDVRHADGRQLQRVGLQPDIVVHPTIAGIRQGKDEVLDRAIAYVRTHE